MAHSIPGAYFTLINHLTPTTHNIPNNSYIPTGHIVTWSVLTKVPFYPQQAISPLTTNSTLDSLFKKFFLKYCKTHKSNKVHIQLFRVFDGSCNLLQAFISILVHFTPIPLTHFLILCSLFHWSWHFQNFGTRFCYFWHYSNWFKRFDPFWAFSLLLLIGKHFKYFSEPFGLFSPFCPLWPRFEGLI